MKMMIKLENENVTNEHSANDYCCEKMKEAFLSNRFELHFEKRFSETFCDRRDHGGGYWYWDFCPFCGKSIKSKNEEYARVLKKELGIDDPYDDEVEKTLPEEFKTDEWWKKRGL